jgi:hypothetical protein
MAPMSVPKVTETVTSHLLVGGRGAGTKPPFMPQAAPPVDELAHPQAIFVPSEPGTA